MKQHITEKLSIRHSKIFQNIFPCQKWKILQRKVPSINQSINQSSFDGAPSMVNVVQERNQEDGFMIVFGPVFAGDSSRLPLSRAGFFRGQSFVAWLCDQGRFVGGSESHRRVPCSSLRFFQPKTRCREHFVHGSGSLRRIGWHVQNFRMDGRKFWWM